MNTISASQLDASPSIRGDELFNAILAEIALTTFPRNRIDADEVASEVYVRISEDVLPPPGSDEFISRLSRIVRHVLRDLRRKKKIMLDIDDIEPEEHPMSMSDQMNEEILFEKTFEAFCRHHEPVKGRIYRLSRTHGKEQIAKLVNRSPWAVRNILKTMAHDFRLFLKKIRD